MKKFLLWLIFFFLMSNISIAQWRHIAASGYHVLALKNNTLWSWGANYSGQLGVGTNVSKTYTPTQIGIENKWIAIATGHLYSLALDEDSTLWAWGDNGWGQFGDGTTNMSYMPKQIDKKTKWISISAGEGHTLGVKKDGTLWGWGVDNYFQIAIPYTNGSATPLQIGKDSDWIKVEAGWDFSFAIKKDGHLWAWGHNLSGQLGVGNNDDILIPTKVGDYKWIDISAGSDHTLGIRDDSTLWTWGSNYSGQLGTGLFDDSNVPTKIGTDKWKSVSAGNWRFSFGLKEDNSVWAWGNNDDGQLGTGDYMERKVPVKVNNESNEISAGYLFTGLINQTTNSICLTGSNSDQQLATATITMSDTFLCSNQSVLSIALLQFSVQKLSQNALITWVASSNNKNDFFVIEKSLNGTQFYPLKTINAVESIRHSYQSIDDNTNSLNFYRIKMITNVGDFIYSNIICLAFEKSFITVIYPNPTTNFLNIAGLNSLTVNNVSIFDFNGTLIKSISTNNSDFKWDIQTLPKGLYYLKVQNNTQVINIKFEKI